MKYHLWTIGCQMNVADSMRVASALENLGYRPTSQAEQADVIVLNTCVVRQSAEDKAYGRLQSLKPIKQQRPEVVINIMGCMVGVKGNAGLMKAFPFVDVFSPPADPAPLIEYLQHNDGRVPELLDTAARHAIMDGERILPPTAQGQVVSAYVTAVHGCSHGCAYCVIPYRRGPERSEPIDHILRQVEVLAEQGVREVTLLGQIVDRYGKDLPGSPTLADLLRQVHTVPGIQRIRFLTSHPNWMTDDLLEAVAELPKVCEHLEVPVQAGDDEVLQRMKRGYTAAEYRRLIDHIRRKLPGVSIATDVIVGFPGETEAQFQKTYDLLAELKMDVAHLARYSERPGTVAARRLADDVPEDVKMARFRALEELQEQIASQIQGAHLGHTVEVLVTEKQGPRWKGRTRTNKLVFFESPADHLGEVVPVRITWAGPWSMRGEPTRQQI